MRTKMTLLTRVSLTRASWFHLLEILQRLNHDAAIVRVRAERTVEALHVGVKHREAVAPVGIARGNDARRFDALRDGEGQAGIARENWAVDGRDRRGIGD